MSLNHSEATHQQLLDRVPQATGRDLPQWFEALEAVQDSSASTSASTGCATSTASHTGTPRPSSTSTTSVAAPAATPEPHG